MAHRCVLWAFYYYQWQECCGALNGRIGSLNYLIANGADVTKDSDVATPLDALLKVTIRLEESETGLEESETADLLRKNGGKSAAEDSLHVAAMVGNIEAVKQHLADGADVNAKDKNGRTPLDCASTLSKTETANILQKQGGKYGHELKATGN